MPTRPFPRSLRLERGRLSALLRTETVGGALLVVAAVLAIVAANSPLSDAYQRLRDLRFGPAALGLDLSVAQWTADGLLALFFFLAGLELKRELVVGELRDPRRAAVPVAAAVGGMAVPAVIYLVINAGNPGAEVGWAIPTATDIAFALAVLAVVGRHLPAVLRTFLLTLAVVDDLLAIIVIALFYSHGVQPWFLLAALVPIAVFGLVVQNRITAWWVLLPLAVTGWALMHASGVHATVAGVLMGFTVPVRPRRAGPASTVDVAERLDRRLRPLSAGIAVPLFAFFAAGVSVGGIEGLTSALGQRVTLGIAVGLLAGKLIGIAATTLITARLTRSTLLKDLAIPDLIGLAVLGGVGFTVSLLIGELSFGSAAQRSIDVRIGVLAGSLISALVAALILAIRSRRYRIAALP